MPFLIKFLFLTVFENADKPNLGAKRFAPKSVTAVILGAVLGFATSIKSNFLLRLQFCKGSHIH